MEPFCVASGKREEDPLSVMWRAYRDGKSCTESGGIWSSGVGGHVKTTNWFRFSCRLTPHVAWKESALAFVCHTIPTPIGSSVWRKGGSISGTWRPLVVAAIRISTAISIRRDHVVGVRVMSTRVCHGGWRSTNSERHDECTPGLGHHDEFLLKLAHCRGLSTRQRPKNPVAEYSPFAR